MSEAKRIRIGRIGGSYGVKGWMKVQSFTVPVDNILDYHPWLINLKGKWQTISIAEGRVHGKGIVVKISGCDQPEDVSRYTNNEIWVAREQLPDLAQDQYYWTDLEGLSVETLQGIVLGNVDHLIDTGSNDVLVIKGETQHMVPFLREQVIKQVDLASGKIVVDWDPDF